MYRQAKLITSAQAVQARIWKSLPLNYRFATVLRVALRQWTPLNQIVHAKMLQAGVTGMPPLKGMPGEEFVAQATDRTGRNPYEGRAGFNRLLAILPDNYGAEFGQKMWNTVVSMLHKNIADAEDILAQYSILFLDRYADDMEPVEYKAAQSWVLGKLRRMVQDKYRKDRTQRKYVSPDEFGSGGADDESLSHIQRARDPEDLVQFIEDEMEAKEIRDILRDAKPELDRIHPHAMDYVEWLMDHGRPYGFLNEYDIRTPTGAPMSTSNWTKSYKGPIVKTLLKHIMRNERIENRI